MSDHGCDFFGIGRELGQADIFAGASQSGHFCGCKCKWTFSRVQSISCLPRCTGVYIFRTLYLFSYFSTFFVNIIMTIIFSPCSFSLLIIGDDPLFREQAVASFVGLMFDLLSENVRKEN